MWYKLLDAEGRACNSSSHWQWPLPTKNADGSWSPGEWTPVITPVKVCECGYHLVDAAHILRWRGATLWEAEIAPGAEKIEDESKIVVSQARLLRQIEAYTPRTLRLLACDYAERVLPIWEGLYPDDPRPRIAISMARRYANGEATKEELHAAAKAAYAAADAEAAYAAADAAAKAAYAATEAAYAAAADAAYAAADAAYANAEAAYAAADAATEAAYAAAEAAYAAAYDVAAVAAEAAEAAYTAYAAANAAANTAAERAWQTERLCEILGLE